MARHKQYPTAWRSTPEGAARYHTARAKAQAEANSDGYDRGLEPNDIFKSWCTFRLPGKANRYGHERLCEVVSCEDLSKCQPGHGPC
jgi:hypothetical protein